MTKSLRQVTTPCPASESGRSEDSNMEDLSAYSHSNVRLATRPRAVSKTSRLEANRRNASRSTGPKSPKGKARAARNSFRHGLSLPPGPEWSRSIRILARRIAGTDRSATNLAAARRVAEAQIQIVRVRNERVERLREAREDPSYQPSNTIHMSQKLAILLLERSRDSKRHAVEHSMIDQVVAWQLADAEQRRAAVQKLAETFAPLDLYQGRALSRHKSAVRAWDRLRNSADQASHF